MSSSTKEKDDVKDYSKVCDYCLGPEGAAHCQDINGVFRGCHESFSDRETLRLHTHGGTGGCRFPGGIEDFYRKDGVWNRKLPKVENSAQSPD